MRDTTFRVLARPVILVAVLAILTSLTACQTTQERERAARSNDSQTCIEFGAERGTSEYTTCMLQQQERRDTAALRAAEVQRANAATTSDNLETVRRLGCEREAEKERKRGEKPRDCR
ncbi:hypothetical protein [Rheinheimera sp. EpRS3]|uniref:hypothetical protein n=1 Tax=Rheinheimera sp. EpRS3 TaxID=1712383 RepID=UPI00074747D6|nr:hypothetical protein [Rheinheimera sp. EpRS3]KUM52601.1 hypothetical protein AR688_09955 [Rheinheimera sp. EpRS3]